MTALPQRPKTARKPRACAPLRNFQPWILCLVLVLGATLLAACGKEPPRYSPLPPGSVVLAFGDSVTYGTGARRGEDYPNLLAQLTGWQVINAGIPGERSDVALPRLNPLLTEHQPQLVLVWLGGNDFLQRRPAAQVTASLREILAEVRQAGAQPVLIAVPAFSPLGAAVGRLADADLYAELARELDVPLIASVFSSVLSDAKLRADAVHPNAEGYRQLTEGFAASLRQHGLLGPN